MRHMVRRSLELLPDEVKAAVLSHLKNTPRTVSLGFPIPESDVGISMSEGRVLLSWSEETEV